ncbi:MAG: DUF1553 domain-containing protein [Planctomycetaceae bacterium]
MKQLLFRSRGRAGLCLVGCLLSSCLQVSYGSDLLADYRKQIRPLLRQRCVACHGALRQEAGLRLDTVALMLAGGDSGPAIVRGDVANSLLLKRVSATDMDERMPPEKEGEALSAAQIKLIRDWITAGAPAPKDEQPDASPADHWSFRRVVRPEVPALTSDWIRNPIDVFLTQQHRQRGLTPQPEASRILLCRRLYLDLIGLPPTAAEVAAFEQDRSPRWYAHLVQKLLDDPRYGERWARHWMDIWRYSDWWGLGQQLRNSQKHIWHWRDWIVESLNAGVPYDEMVRQMLAADELYPGDPDKLRATGFLARNYFLFNRPQWMEETVEHVGKGFLGLTLNCARCHAHKYDPVEHADFYRMRAFFEPYHVRLDILPGEADLSRDGLPRVFDGLLEEPTYRYIRGDEKNPDRSTVILPGVPKFLAFRELRIEPVALPVEAWQPERRAWVLQAHAAASEKKLSVAAAVLKAAQEKLASAQVNADKALARSQETAAQAAAQKPKSGSRGDGIEEDFRTLEQARWKLFGGDWVHTPGRLEQKQDGPTRAALRLLERPPGDFDATVRFTILGGSRWRSVALAFDAAAGDPTRDSVSAYSEKNVYVSAVSPGSKIHAAYNESGRWHYPSGGAVHQLPVALKQEHTLRVQVRGRLINAALDGNPVIACQSPLPRRAGAMQLTTFDALTVFHEFRIQALDPDIPLRLPGDSTPSPKMAAADVALAQAGVDVAAAGLAVARAERTGVARRVEAMQAEWKSADENTPRSEHAAAVHAVRRVAVEKARHAVAVADRSLLQAASDRQAEAEKSLQSARESLRKTLATVETEIQPSDTYPRFRGAEWTPTRFFSSGKDDPAVTFPSHSTGRRTALANWMTDPRNPLTARVAVNHIWMRHLGRPLVPTVFDFGRNGVPPVNPELLDWLAAELMEHDWSLKHLHRLIVTSAAYRMSSSRAGGEASAARDPGNRCWWRREPLRLESQAVRDSLLSLAGTLDVRRGGPPVPRAEQAASTRRSLYFFHSNNDRNLFLRTFDEALVKDCYRREHSIVPQQALALTNSRIVLETSEIIAGRLSDNSLESVEFIRTAFVTILGIHPGDAAVAASRNALDAWRQLPGGTVETARTHLIRALINHNDFVTVR